MSSLSFAEPAFIAKGARVLRRGFAPMAVMATLSFLIIYPFGMLVYAAFVDAPPRPGSPPANITLQNFAALLSEPTFEAALNSLICSAGGSALAIAIGSGLAWLVARTDVPGRALVGLAGVMPLFMSALVGSLAYALIASPRTGYINLILRDLGVPVVLNIYSHGGIIFVLGLFYAPYSFLLMSSALRLMSPELEEAAAAHGATRASILRKITFPLVKPALLGAGILTIVLIMENFPVLQVLGTPARIETLPTIIYRYMVLTPPRPNEAAAVGMLLLVLMIGMVYAQSRLLRQRSFVTVGGKGFRPKRFPLGAWRWPAFALALAYVLLACVLPVFALAQSALRSHQFIANSAALFDLSRFGLKNLEEVLTLPAFRTAALNSVIVGVTTAILGAALHFVVSYYVHRTEYPFRRAVEYIAMAPASVPALLMGMGFLWAWISVPLPIYGTLTILVLAFVACFMPQGFRSISATIVQVHKDLEDSAVVAGASRVKAARSILAPLIIPGIAATMLLLFILSVRELSTSLFLFTTSTRVLSIVVYEQWEAGRWALMATMSLFYSGFLLIVAIAGWRWLDLKTV